ncbi:MAG: hypothetical protein L0L30_08900 [Brevibacterium sp.]|nr:hypothetical protein [Brevibacterium sp.]
MDPTWIQYGLTVAEDHHGVGRVCEAIKGCELPVAVAIHGYCIGERQRSRPPLTSGSAERGPGIRCPRCASGFPRSSSPSTFTGNCFSAEDMDTCGFLNAVVDDSAAEDRALGYLYDTMRAPRAVIAQQKRLHRTWKNSFEREALADSKKEFALAFARKHG